MIVRCRHGFLEYRPQRSTDLKRFERLQRVKLVPEKDYFTFEGLVNLPRYSLQGSPYKNLIGVVNYEGRDAAEVMRENGFVYHYATKLLILKELVLTTANIPATQDRSIAPSCFIQPGAVLQNGKRLVGYEGEIDLEVQRLYLYSMEFSL